MSDGGCVIEEAAGIQWGQTSCQARQFDCLLQKTRCVMCDCRVAGRLRGSCFVSRGLSCENSQDMQTQHQTGLVELPLSKTMEGLFSV